MPGIKAAYSFHFILSQGTICSGLVVVTTRYAPAALRGFATPQHQSSDCPNGSWIKPYQCARPCLTPVPNLDCGPAQRFQTWSSYWKSLKTKPTPRLFPNCLQSLAANLHGHTGRTVPPPANLQDAFHTSPGTVNHRLRTCGNARQVSLKKRPPCPSPHPEISYCSRTDSALVF